MHFPTGRFCLPIYIQQRPAKGQSTLTCHKFRIWGLKNALFYLLIWWKYKEASIWNEKWKKQLWIGFWRFLILWAIIITHIPTFWRVSKRSSAGVLYFFSIKVKLKVLTETKALQFWIVKKKSWRGQGKKL